MFHIDSRNNIRLIQGDTAAFDLNLDNYMLQEGDRVFFSIKRTSSDSGYVVQKIITAFEDGGCQIQLSSSDTNLPCGDYIYDVQCSLADGRVDTVIGPSYFYVLGGVTNDESVLK